MNSIDFAVSISGHGTALMWGYGMVANIAAEEQAPWSAWDQLDDVATVIRYDVRKSSSAYGGANPGR